MHPDPGRALMDARVKSMTPTERTLVSVRLRAKGMAMVWQQLDEAAPMTEPGRAMFLIDRLYPEMPSVHREQFRQQFEARWQAGTWHGFRRPAPLSPSDDP